MAIMSTPDRILFDSPRWQPDDLGAPLPESPHANSVCLPQWQDVIDYEEKRPRVMEKLRAGYPRFVVPAFCAKFFEQCRAKFGRTGELCHAYPSARSANRAAEMIGKWSGLEARVVPWPGHRVFVVCFPAAAAASAQKYWRHAGEGISSRRAESLLSGKPEIDATQIRQRLQDRIAGLAGVPADCVYLFKSGMAAIYTLHRMMMRMRPDGSCAQFGFPYVDTLKIQQDFGFRSVFFPVGNKNDLKMLERIALIDRVSGIFCEFPSNPLLASPDLQTLSKIARRQHIPLIVDETVSSWHNVDLLAAADITVTSLTKYFTGRGDVMGGAAIINPTSPRVTQLRSAFRAEYEDTTWGDDLIVMEEQSRDFAERMKRINETTANVVDWLNARPEIDRVYYPTLHTREVYDRYKRPSGGYSGLFSLLLNDAAKTTPAFYNNLRFSKGPNLGTTFSLCCPFTMLAHYDELDWAEQCGVSRHLIRFSIGLEPAGELIRRLETALRAI